MKPSISIGLNLLSAGLILVLASLPSIAQEDAETAHIAVENPAALTQEQANQIYQALKQTLADRYAPAKLDLIDNYQSWKRFNSAPYLSATHGQRFVNNYANEHGRDYGQLKPGETYPEGTIFAKDTITVTDQGKNFPGAMFVMEKLPVGKSPQTADWRYVMVIPDGSIFGDTTGDEPELVEYCHACHIAKARQDYVFYVPKAFRISP